MNNIYIRIDGENIGPLSIEEVVSHKIELNTPVWYEGLGEWTTVKNIPELVALVKIAPPPFINSAEDNSNKATPKNAAPPPYNAGTTASTSTDAKTQSADKPLASNPNQKFIIIGIVAIVIIAIVVRMLANNSSSYSTSMEAIPRDSVAQAMNSGISSPTGGANIDAYTTPAESYSGPDEITLKNMEYRNNWTKYITASRSAYNYSELGGITNLSIVVSNGTEYTMNYVAVTVKYITVNGYIHKTETVDFYDIQPGTKQALPAPDSERGTKVEYEISIIRSQKLHFCYDSHDLQGNGSINDPWKCVD